MKVFIIEKSQYSEKKVIKLYIFCYKKSQHSEKESRTPGFLL